RAKPIEHDPIVGEALDAREFFEGFRGAVLVHVAQTDQCFGAHPGDVIGAAPADADASDGQLGIRTVGGALSRACRRRKPIAGPQGLSIETEHPRGRSMTTRAHVSDESTRRINVCDSERLLSVGVGSGLAVYGLTRGSLAGLATAAIGGCIAYRGVTGHCELYHALGINTAESRGPLNSVRQGHGCRVEK